MFIASLIRVLGRLALRAGAAGSSADAARIAVEDDALGAGQRDKALALGAADQGQPGLPRQLDAPGGEARARDQDRDAHLHGLDHHLGGQPAGRVEDLARRARCRSRCM